MYTENDMGSSTTDPRTNKPVWEHVGSTIWRFKVDGGYLYQDQSGGITGHIVFVPSV